VASNYIGQCENQKMKIPLFQVKWMKDGKRVVTSSNKGQLIVWDALNFDHFQSCDVHRERVYAMAWTNYQKFLITGDKAGYIVYCDNIIDKKNMFKAHNDTCIKDISCSMSSAKFATCSDDGTARVFDFATSRQEMVFQEHNSEVNSVDWHPFQSLVVTGSKDHTIRIWDARSASSRSIFQVQAHNSTVLQTRWNPINGIYLLTGSRDMKVKLFDIRCLR
jgi:polyadenylation factor subunit 2